ncbi:MAG: outer membrane lipoprotein-sorting protein, partial [Verrucomicrobiales bacterium]
MVSSAAGQETVSATDVAARLATAVTDGDSATRLRLKIEAAQGGDPTVLQVQVKARRVAGKSEVVYQVLWPKDRKGQAFLIQQEGNRAPTGFVYSPPKTLTTLTAARMKESVFGSDLAYQDVVENFFRWEKQGFSGKETVDRVECLILESRPGSKDSTSYGMVRSWIDLRRLVALRVEKYDSAGKL